MERIEMRAKLKFKKIGAPQPVDIIKASSRDIAMGLKNVSDDVTPYFVDIAKDLIKELGSELALIKALAYISGYTEKVQQRSILCSIEGFITYVIKTNVEF